VIIAEEETNSFSSSVLRSTFASDLRSLSPLDETETDLGGASVIPNIAEVLGPESTLFPIAIRLLDCKYSCLLELEIKRIENKNDEIGNMKEHK
jgi:hypothetical protein